MPRSVTKWHTEGHGNGMEGVWRVYGGGTEGERWGKGGGPVASRPPSSVPFWHTTHCLFQMSTSNRCPKNLLSPLIPKNTVESTPRRKAAKTQGFRLVGSFPRLTMSSLPISLPLAALPLGVFALAAVSRLFNPQRQHHLRPVPLAAPQAVSSRLVS